MRWRRTPRSPFSFYPVSSWRCALRIVQGINWLVGNIGSEGNPIGAVGAERIARALEKNTTVTWIGLGRMLWNDAVRGSLSAGMVPKIGTAGTEHIAHALERNTTIKTIFLDC